MRKWIDCEQSLPPDRYEVLFYATTNKGMTKEIMTGHRENGKWMHCCLFYSSMILHPEDVQVTHWMEMPSYPEEKK